jgi:hypothetical protein
MPAPSATEGATGVPLLVMGGVETGLRPLAGTEQVLDRRWQPRTAARPVTILGRPLPDDPADSERMMHPRVIADALAIVLRDRDLTPTGVHRWC